MTTWEIIVKIFNILITISGIVSPLLLLYLYFQAKTKKTAVIAAKAAETEKVETEKAVVKISEEVKMQSEKATELETIVWAKAMIAEKMVEAEDDYTDKPMFKFFKRRDVFNAVRYEKDKNGYAISDKEIYAMIEEYMDLAKKLNPRVKDKTQNTEV